MRSHPASFIALTLLAASQTLMAQTDASLLRFVNPRAKAAIGINWGRIQQTRAGELMRDRFGDSPIPLPGVDFLRDVERVVITSTGSPNEEDPQEPPILMAVRGRFNAADLRKLLVERGAKRQMYGDFSVYRPQDKGGKDLAIAPVDAQTVLVGDAGSVFSALEHNGYASMETSPLVTRATELDSSSDLWAVLASPRALASQHLMELFTGEELGDDARSIEAAISFRDGMTMSLNIVTPSDEAAKKLSSTISKVVNLSARDKPTNPALADLERKLKVGVDKSAVVITLRLSKDELTKTAGKFDQYRKEKEKQLAEAQLAAKASAPLPPPPPKMVIKIDGLDDGAREIPYKQ
jgi:hypothetical protein